MSGIRCWQCEAEPEMVDVRSFGDLGPVYIPGAWTTAAEDHVHALRPPTPQELVDAGSAALARVRGLA